MPRYFFHLQDGKFLPDRDGKEFSTAEEARRYAIHLSGQLLSDAEEGFWDGTEWQLTVTDESKCTLFTLNFYGTSNENEARR